MEENIIGLIREAEEQAAARKVQAQLDAAEIVAAAERTSADILKSAEEGCKTYLAEALKGAEACAESDYAEALAKSRAEAEQTANELLEHADVYVTEIVGRLTK